MPSTLAWMLALVVTSGCVEDAVDDAVDDGPVSDDTVFYETVATMTPDGLVFGDPTPITAGQQRAQNEYRRALERGEAIAPWSATFDSACAPTSLWHYARTDWTGDRICFTGCGTASTAEFWRYRNLGGQIIPIGTYELATGSYWPGDRPGILAANLAAPNPTFIPFSAWGPARRFDVSPHRLQGIGVGFANVGDPCP